MKVLATSEFEVSLGFVKPCLQKSIKNKTLKAGRLRFESYLTPEYQSDGASFALVSLMPQPMSYIWPSSGCHSIRYCWVLIILDRAPWLVIVDLQ